MNFTGKSFHQIIFFMPLKYSFRALQKKIRAEEMLRVASLPPSMAKREKHKLKTSICNRAISNFHCDEQPRKKSTRKKHRENDLSELMREYLSYSPKPLKKTKKKRVKMNKINFILLFKLNF